MLLVQLRIAPNNKLKLRNAKTRICSDDYLSVLGMRITEVGPMLFSLYKKIENTEKIFYIDVCSMYPTVMCLDQYFYPIGEHEVRRADNPNMPLVPLDELFGLQKCHVIPPNNLYHPVLPERNEETGKLLFPLYPNAGTWTHVELQKAVSLGYVIDKVYKQHHFPPQNRSNELFKHYINTFFEMKKKADQENNKGLKQVAKLCLNSFYGKFGFNIMNQSHTSIIRTHQQLWKILKGSYTRATAEVINDAVAIANFHNNDEYTIHQKSNVYIAAYVTAYARLKLYEALEILQEKVLYFDTDSVVYCSPTGDHLVPISTSGDLGTWTDESPGDFFTEFVSSGPKTYAMKSQFW
jgi:DNA polymerase elongation subunit (family B)